MLMEPVIQNLNVTDGQLAASVTTITSGPASKGRRLNLTFCNTGSQSETIVLTLSRQGGTARRIRRFTLDPDEQADYQGLAVDKADVLYGYSTNANVVDYTVSMCPPEGAGGAPGPSWSVYDEDGILKLNNVSAGELLALAEE